MKKNGNKTKIIELLQEQRSSTAESISEVLGIQRNTASGILNELARDGIVKKEKTRPVIFTYMNDERKNISDDPFYSFIGADKSLKEQVEKCKLSVAYPKKGMSVLILGPSGVGKSLLAEYIYRYAKYKHAIAEDAPFVVLNCADYANNKELLSSILFGYKKGAFTGADKDTKGLIEKADNGYLFLDEVHRLPPEGQEKLFRYMDKGIVSKVGDNAHEYKLNVRLIFATTEEKQLMLDTFLRRIPIDITLPAFEMRTLEERYQLVLHIFYKEAVTMDCKFQVSNNVLNRLLMFQGKGNIGTLNNIIKLCCARAYSEKETGVEEISVTLNHLSKEQQFMTGTPKVPYVRENVEISPEKPEKLFLPAVEYVDFSVESIKKAVQQYQEKKISRVQFQNTIYSEINHMVDDVVYQKMEPFLQNMYQQSIHNIMVYLQDNYGLKYNGIMEIVLVKMLNALNNQSQQLDDQQFEATVLALQPMMYQYYKMGMIFYEMIHQVMDYEANPWFVRLFVMLYFYSLAKEDTEYMNAIIVSHGSATASSIASMVNRVFETYIFEPFDMEYDTPKSEIVYRITKYLKNINTSKGLLILVDMGSLLSISEDLADDVEGDLGIVNNVTTEMALEAGEHILIHADMQKILDDTVAHHVTKQSFIQSQQKPKAIVLCCMTGLGTAAKMKKMLQDCLGELDIEVAVEAFRSLEEKGSQCEVFRRYNVQFIISTSKLEVEGYTVLALNELIEERGENVIYATVGRYFEKSVVQNFIENTVHNFTVQNLIGQLTILNPDKIIDDVEHAVMTLELMENVTYPIGLKKMLYMHICVMIERLILEKGLLPEEELTQIRECRESFIKNLKESFSVVEKKYNVSVNAREIQLIYDLTQNI